MHSVRTADEARFDIGEASVYTDLARTNRLAEEGRLIYEVKDPTLFASPSNRFLEIPAQDPTASRYIGNEPFYDGRVTENGNLYGVVRDDTSCGGWAVTRVETSAVVVCMPLVPDESAIQQLYISEDERSALVAYTVLGGPVFAPNDIVVFSLDGSGVESRRFEALDIWLSDVHFHAPTGAVYLVGGGTGAVYGLAEGATAWQRVYTFPSGNRPGRRMLIDGDRMITYDRDGEGAGTASTVLFLDVSEGPDGVHVVDQLRLPFPVWHQYLHGRYLVFRSIIQNESRTQFAGFCLDDPDREVRTRTVTLPAFGLKTSGFSHSMTCAEGL